MMSKLEVYASFINVYMGNAWGDCEDLPVIDERCWG